MNATESQIRAEQIVRSLYYRGINLVVIDGKLHYKGMLGDIVTDNDLADLSDYEAEIIALLLKESMPFIWTAPEGAGDEEDTPFNVVSFPAPRDGRETDEAG